MALSIVDARAPTQPLAELLIGESVSFPLCSAAASVKGRRELALGSLRVLFPEPAQAISHAIRNSNRKVSPRATLVGSQELAAREKLVVDNVENLAVHAGLEPGEDDRIGTIVDKRQGQKIGSAHLDEDAKRVDADATAQISSCPDRRPFPA